MNGKEFIESIIRGECIANLPTLENPNLDNLENLDLPDRIYTIYSYLYDSASIDKNRLLQFEIELRFIKTCNRLNIPFLKNADIEKISNAWQETIKAVGERELS